MQYKLLCIDSDWLLKENRGIWLWQENVDGCPKVPSGTPILHHPQRMKNFNEVVKGLGGLVNL
jgi:hypothetical protein